MCLQLSDPLSDPRNHRLLPPPRSAHGSLDSLNEDSSEPISRRSTMESQSSEISQSAQHEWMKNEHLGAVTGLPTRTHWKVSISRRKKIVSSFPSFGAFIGIGFGLNCALLKANVV